MGNDRSPVGHRAPRTAIWALASVAALVLAACAGTATKGSTGKPVKGGTASYALGGGVGFTWAFPLDNQANYEPEDGNVQADLWRPLYFAGSPGATGVYQKFSLANPPVYSNHDQTVTITLKRNYKWSDGTPVTTKDIRFFFQLEAAGVKLGKYAPYVPGTMPNDIRASAIRARTSSRST